MFLYSVVLFHTTLYYLTYCPDWMKKKQMTDYSKLDLASLTVENQALFIKHITSGTTLAKHIDMLIRSRTIKVEGDDSHTTVRSIKRVYRDIDKPKAYDWMADDVYEQEAIHQIGWEHPASIMCDADAVMAGTASAIGRNKHYVCHDCNMPLQLTLTGNTISISGDGPCISNASFDVTIHFPTGEILSGDFPVGFREWKEHTDNQDRMADVISLNGMLGIRNRTECWAGEDIGHFFVGNTSPNVMLTTDGLISVLPGEQDLDGTKLTNICTDFWWATMVDVQIWRSMMTVIGMVDSDIEQMLNESKENGSIFNIKPGYWKFSYTQPSDDNSTNCTIVGEWLKS